MFKNVILLNIFFIKIDFYSEKLFHVFYLQPHQLHSSQLVEPIVPMGYSFYWTVTIVFHHYNWWKTGYRLPTIARLPPV